ncbi:hypothetical protein [Bradyrhizobium sp. BR13661]|jgi:hypothetical protein|uniref:hypothetical protein n=1 Tax=Bradyrhizobium sp. BR13661 TaxID=2940622 RepID=UPI002474CE4B|nr:hypothetical protein [Bradyrhizobium sp. BR13661]MDH6256646.1 hypothetical protein [Bradyrhizobium sp. BR13661]
MEFLYFCHSPRLENLWRQWHFTAVKILVGATWIDFDPSQDVRPKLRNSCARTERNEEYPMMDILMLALAAAFFALAIGYTYACERL